MQVLIYNAAKQFLQLGLSITDFDANPVLCYNTFMKFIWFSLLCAFMVVSACSTTEHSQKKYHTDGWSSSEPLSIPYAIRLGQFERDNLVANPSFEKGLPPIGTAETDIGIKSWDIIGQNVSWVDRESPNFTNEDVNTGRHAIKIIRETANELDEAEGYLYLPLQDGKISRLLTKKL